MMAHNINLSKRIHKTGKEKWTKKPSSFHFLIPDVGYIPTDHDFNRTAWIWLNCLVTGVGRFGSLMLKR